MDMLENEKTPIKVMLVDDEQGLTTLTKLNLERDGEFIVAVENDPLKAVDRARVLQPDIIVLDMVMPGMDGGDVAARVRNTPELANVKLIILTALVSQAEAPDGTVPIAVGGDRCRALAKPVKIELLRQTILEELNLV